MAVLKVACPKCGQRVSGDDTFYGTTVECPVCSSTIRFPASPSGSHLAESPANADPPPARSSDPGLDHPAYSLRPKSESPPQSQAQPGPSAVPPKLETSSIPLSPRSQSPKPATQSGEVTSPLLGVVSMVLGIVSVALLCLPGILFGPAAIIAGHIAVAKARNSRVRPVPGRAAAITGLILGYISLIGFILITLYLGPLLVEKIRASAPPE